MWSIETFDFYRTHVSSWLDYTVMVSLEDSLTLIADLAASNLARKVGYVSYLILSSSSHPEMPILPSWASLSAYYRRLASVSVVGAGRGVH